MKKLYPKFLLSVIICFFGAISFAQQKSITGTVRGSDGNPVAKASVLIKGTSTGVATDASGDFNISVNGTETVLTVSSVGYKTKDITVGKSNHLDVFLDGGAGTLNEVVIVGYGTQKKVNLTGAVSTVDTKNARGQAGYQCWSGSSGGCSGIKFFYSRAGRRVKPESQL